MSYAKKHTRTVRIVKPTTAVSEERMGYKEVEKHCKGMMDAYNGMALRMGEVSEGGLGFFPKGSMRISDDVRIVKQELKEWMSHLESNSPLELMRPVIGTSLRATVAMGMTIARHTRKAAKRELEVAHKQAKYDHQLKRAQRIESALRKRKAELESRIASASGEDETTKKKSGRRSDVVAEIDSSAAAIGRDMEAFRSEMGLAAPVTLQALFGAADAHVRAFEAAVCSVIFGDVVNEFSAVSAGLYARVCDACGTTVEALSTNQAALAAVRDALISEAMGGYDLLESASDHALVCIDRILENASPDAQPGVSAGHRRTRSDVGEEAVGAAVHALQPCIILGIALARKIAFSREIFVSLPTPAQLLSSDTSSAVLASELVVEYGATVKPLLVWPALVSSPVARAPRAVFAKGLWVIPEAASVASGVASTT
eukprot:Opistho-1_new@68137